MHATTPTLRSGPSKKNADGSYSIINAITGMLLDVNGGAFKSGTNVWVYTSNGSMAQKWTFAITDALANGVYSLILNTGRVMDVPGGSTAAGVQPQTYTSNSTFAQKWKVTKSGSGYTIQSLTSGKYLTNDGNGNLKLQAKNSATSQIWNVGFNWSGMLLISASNAKAYIYSKTTNIEAPFLIGTTNTANLKEFRFRNVQILENGNYIVQNLNGNVLDVVNGFFNSGTNVQSYASNGSGAQKWRIEHRGGDVYTLVNLRSEKALDLHNGTTRNGQNVQQYDFNWSGAQRWYFDLDENCNIILRAVNNTNFVLDVSGGSSANGANVQVYQFNNTNAQKWKFVATGGYSITGDGELDNIVRACWARIGEGGDRLWNAFNFVKNFGYRNGSTWPGGDWCNSFAKEMFYNGSGNCYRFAALFCVLGRSIGYSMNAISGSHNQHGTIFPHGWVEVYWDGRTYVCDPDGAHELPQYNWYWVTYGNTALSYRK